MDLHGGNIREAARMCGLTEEKIIDFSASINPLGFPQSLKKAVSGNLNAILHYPDPDCKNLKDALSQYLGVSIDSLLAGNGSMELIYLACSVLKPKKALIPLPAFSEYEKAVRLSAGKNLFLKAKESDGFKMKLSSILKELPKVNLVFLCNPNNPTGSLFNKEELEFLAKECARRGVFLVVDEVFMDFVDGCGRLSMSKFASRNKRVIVLRSFTKFFAFPGLRLGFIIGEKEIIKKVACCQPPWSVNSLAQLAGACVLKEKAFVRKSREYLFKCRDGLFSGLNDVKYLKAYPPSANFIFCKILSHRLNSGKLSDYCGRKGLIIRDCSNFRGLDNSFIRIAVRKKEENERLIEVLRELS